MSRLDVIKDWKERAVAARFGARNLADLCGISYSQLRRHFVDSFGKSPQQYLIEVRLHHAAEMLRSPRLSVKDVARELHYADESHLCHQFKRHFGCRPSEFRVRSHGLKKRLAARIKWQGM